ncbi:Crp/Fnr family transcriptional regulator [Cereibacter sphaeroides]|uniref:Crp/Fnr family transcriptional regulator n=1 Tax=Cereibacter sphaeroides TaxID=1063 RepID=UPI001F32C635|nr:Crp/Fnr family transcriptional regulator [Cereibacter sphaeroides]MCE6951392.1 Crp/Fnr family transcriptional regulator [Cereibacter sphaeroides]MCE6960717.1 Crp/Fnr family transcriptional regulator [Cereibacter sphaeroides]MCE6970017.1 Crp/Fnr family transcriptional regulator [Cereibacter sphaeroides]MCE6974405.1 Crp/Fnr family transcriptional regulator [Cereibacter sphaeroides]
MPAHPAPHSDWLLRLPKGLHRRYAPGEAIARPEGRANRFFVLDSGLARICLNAASRDLVIGYLRPGGIFVTHTRAWVEALEPSEVVSWPVEEMLGLIAREPELGLTAFREIGRLLHGALSLIEDLAFRPVESRLARFLLAERQAQGSDRIRLIDTTEAMASALGTSRQTLSTLLNRLIREGVVARADRRHLDLLRPDRLQDLSELSSG